MIEFNIKKRWIPKLPEILRQTVQDYPEVSATALKGFAVAKSAVYLSEGLPLILINRWLGKNPPPSASLKAYREAVVRHATQLINQDIQNIVDDHYAPDVLWPERSLYAHTKSFVRVLRDGLKLSSRQIQKDHSYFSEGAEAFLGDTPEYYRRNFHFQTDGYLSEESANLYDHQVEILFRGTSDPMRRLLLKPLKQAVAKEDLKVLDLGCGTGTSTRFLAQTFAKAKITAFDLSFPYLKKAQERLPKFTNRIEFVQGAGENLPFKDGQFDVVASTFLFHELPIQVRREVLKEMHRVLKPGGHIAIIDSIQSGDTPELEWGLEQFPRDFHEPFFKNYLQHKMEDLFVEAGFMKPDVYLGFLSKGLLAQK